MSVWCWLSPLGFRRQQHSEQAGSDASDGLGLPVKAQASFPLLCHLYKLPARLSQSKGGSSQLKQYRLLKALRRTLSDVGSCLGFDCFLIVMLTTKRSRLMELTSDWQQPELLQSWWLQVWGCIWKPHVLTMSSFCSCYRSMHFCRSLCEGVQSKTRHLL